MYSLTHPLTPHLPGRVTPKQTDEGTRILAKSLSLDLTWWPLQIISKLFPRSYLLFPWFILCRIRAMQTDRALLVPKPKNNEQSLWPCWTPSVCLLHHCAASGSTHCTPGSWLRGFCLFVLFLNLSTERHQFDPGEREEGGVTGLFPSPPQVSLPGPGTSCIPGSPKPQPLSQGALGLLTYNIIQAAIAANINGFSVFHPWKLFT